jgi:hypothetical protein
MGERESGVERGGAGGSWVRVERGTAGEVAGESGGSGGGGEGRRGRENGCLCMLGEQFGYAG